MFMTKYLRQLADDVVFVGRALNTVFWETAEIAEDVRSRLRERRTLARALAHRQRIHEDLGRLAYTLLAEHVAVERTPDLNAILNDLEPLKHLSEKPLSDSDLDIPLWTTLSWERIRRLLSTGHWTIHAMRVPRTSSLLHNRLEALTERRPPGLCLAVERQGVISVASPDWEFSVGDKLLVLTHRANVATWEHWIESTMGDSDRPSVRHLA